MNDFGATRLYRSRSFFMGWQFYFKEGKFLVGVFSFSLFLIILGK